MKLTSIQATTGNSKRLIVWLSLLWILSPGKVALCQVVEPILPLTHTEPITTIDVHPNDQILLSASDDGTIKLWDISSGLQRQSFQAHDGRVYTACYSPDGTLIASGGQDNIIRLWREGQAEAIREFVGHDGPIQDVAIAKDNKTMLSASLDATVKLWNLQTGRCIRTFSGHLNAVNAVCFSKDEQQVISGGGHILGSVDNSIRIWDINTGKNLATLEGHQDMINDLAISPDGKWIASASDDATIRIWSPKKDKPSITLFENNGISSVDFSPNGTNLLCGIPVDSAVRLWNLKTQTAEMTYQEHSGLVNTVAFSNSGQLFFSAADDVLIKVWDRDQNQALQTFGGQFKPVYACTYSPDGRYIASSNLNDQAIRLWDMRSGHLIQILSAPETVLGANRLEFSPDGQHLICSYIDAHTASTGILIWSTTTGTIKYELPGHQGIINDFELSEDKRYLLSCAAQEVKLWSLDQPQASKIVLQHPADIMTVHFTDNEGEILIGTTNNKLETWSLDGTRTGAFNGHSARVMNSKYTPDRSKILAGGGNIQNSELLLWDVQQATVIRRFNSPHTSYINSIDISPNGKLAVSGSFDGLVSLWDLEANAPLAVLKEHSDYITDVHFSPDNNFIISSSGDNTIRIWDVESQSLAFTLFSLDNEEWGIVSTAGYYACSKELAQKMGFRLGEAFYPFEQFDLRYNRPELIAAKMPNQDTILTKALERAFQKRLRRLGFTLEQLDERFHVPELKLLSDRPSGSTTNRRLSVNISATDEEILLDRILVYVNGVPIHGRRGLDLTAQQVHRITTTLSMELSAGKNRIEISVVNQGMVESRREVINLFLKRQ